MTYQPPSSALASLQGGIPPLTMSHRKKRSIMEKMEDQLFHNEERVNIGRLSPNVAITPDEDIPSDEDFDLHLSPSPSDAESSEPDFNPESIPHSSPDLPLPNLPSITISNSDDEEGFEGFDELEIAQTEQIYQNSMAHLTNMAGPSAAANSVEELEASSSPNSDQIYSPMAQEAQTYLLLLKACVDYLRRNDELIPPEVNALIPHLNM